MTAKQYRVAYIGFISKGMERQMTQPKLERGKYKVTRYCCRSGCCVECHTRNNFGKLDGRQRITHTDNMSTPWAEYVAKNWSCYGTTVEPS